jgi:CAAX prenyl protease-like protein
MSQKMLPGNAPKPRVKRIPLRDRMPWLPYVLPLAVFVVLGALEGQFGSSYPIVYSLKIGLVTGVLVALWPFLPEAYPRKAGVGLAVLLGVVLTVVWVAGTWLMGALHLPFLGKREGYNPFTAIPNAPLRWAFLAVRFFGLVVIAPIVEEVFYRGFLLRYVTDMDDFRRVPLGRFTASAFAVNVVLMALTHPEWLVAGLFSAAMCALLARTRSLFPCIIAHGVTNLLLGVYVVFSQDWKYW